MYKNDPFFKNQVFLPPKMSLFGFQIKVFENFGTKNLESKCTEMAFFQKSSIFTPKIEPFWISN